MESYISIAYLNDYIFCPKSIYFHILMEGISVRTYHESAQIEGKAAHEAIEENRYSSRKSILQGICVYSEKYSLCGKIDLFDLKNGILTERKKHIETVYNGYVFQLYAQFFCLTEMGYSVKEMYLYSMDANKRFPVPLPEDNRKMMEAFEKTIDDIKNTDLKYIKQNNKEKCGRCVYSSLCDEGLC